MNVTIKTIIDANTDPKENNYFFNSNKRLQELETSVSLSKKRKS